VRNAGIMGASHVVQIHYCAKLGIRSALRENTGKCPVLPISMHPKFLR
jgi:hypothetical protein